MPGSERSGAAGFTAAALAVLILWRPSPLAAAEPVARSATAPAWVAESNRHAEVLLDVIARFHPEDAADIGLEAYDAAVMDLQVGVHQRRQDALQAELAELRQRRGQVADPAVRQDLDILIDAATRSIESARLEYELLLPYTSVSRLVFSGIQSLLDPRLPKTRQAAALQRLRAYAGLAPGTTPITELARARSREMFASQGRVGPYRGQIEQDLADTPRLIEGLEKLFAESDIKDYRAPLKRLRKQLHDYDRWLQREMLPRARSEHRLPPALYADRLREVGVDVEPQELIRRALLSFAEIRSEMQTLAALIAAEKAYPSADYRAVIAVLKQQQLAGAEVVPLYRDTLQAIEQQLHAHQIVSVPARTAHIRLANEAESAMLPAPYMSPPRLIGNTGEYGEFVLPLKVPGTAGRADLKTDDFSYRAAAWTLTAHEARPGHEMQFAAMLDKGVSIARVVFAFNSVNVEGWALYAEAEMKPTFPLDGQLIGLQLRLLRAARAFLDPMINLGQLSPDDAKAFLMTEVAVSPGLAQSEVDRYVFRMPGQATAYFYGYQCLLTTRERAQFALGKHFDRQRFHDFVLAQGLLPPAMLEKAVLEDFVPAERARLGSGR